MERVDKWGREREKGIEMGRGKRNERELVEGEEG